MRYDMPLKTNMEPLTSPTELKGGSFAQKCLKYLKQEGMC